MNIYGVAFVAIILASLSVHGQSEDIRLKRIHYIERFDVFPEPDPFLPVTTTQKETWARIVERCTPVNTRKKLGDSCLSLLEEYFSNEPVWEHDRRYYYHYNDGWISIPINRVTDRMDFSHADFIDINVPLWGDIFDDQIDERQQRFLKVLKDPSCKELGSLNIVGIHETRKEKCAARELFKYATYLAACSDSQQRLNFLQQKSSAEMFEGLDLYEISLKGLEEWVPDTALRYSAEQQLLQGYLHDYWVNQQCNLHGYVEAPAVSDRVSNTTNRAGFSRLNVESVNPWLANLETSLLSARGAHNLALRIAAKSGDDWAIRSKYLSARYTSDFNQDVMKKYPLLMHRVLGRSGSFLTPQEMARHRAKAYLLLVEQAGEDVARQEYDPSKLQKEIRYVKRGGVLRPPPTRKEVQETPFGQGRRGTSE
ncbi:MAG: hypothetical protein OXO49_01600 [Gammaproteobacteria bacterium]|nr:hypothetical protein [Gammaproteobacteria bacterium]MDE0252516.1 hypothetical protein [Gammaproteobacteria bacterium]MDE0403000.1 hypothetical protein [Gammaproteobacteria bacterium]